ncbi:VTC domain-containing protein [Streptomyces daliensis]|uniref:VTC domain-containing protein n=1 Tax=Streptomyces daliensis TaxID=299421 RepID=A0A8T4IXP1_9ACTN|nr:VTC domain-containing protein [Streptomyces daliensis]
MTAPAVRAIGRAALSAHPIALSDVLARAQLLARFDRAYFVPARVFLDFAARLTDPRRRDPFRALSIDGRRWFRYHSVYYDTEGLRSYHDHRQERRHRFKIRERLYEDSGERQFELKLKGSRGETVKYRQPLEGSALGDRPRRFLEETLSSVYGIEAPTSLRPSLVTDYLRATLVAEGQRITCDAGLVCRDAAADESRGVRGASDLVLVETKSAGHLTEADRMLHAYGIRPADFTKYAALGALRPSLPSNRWHRGLATAFPGRG